jgi:hypothetical protein
MTDTLIARVYRLANKLGGTVYPDEETGAWEIRVAGRGYSDERPEGFPAVMGILIGPYDIDDAEAEYAD